MSIFCRCFCSQQLINKEHNKEYHNNEWYLKPFNENDHEQTHKTSITWNNNGNVEDKMQMSLKISLNNFLASRYMIRRVMYCGTHLLFGGVLGHHVTEVLLLHLLLSDVLLVLLRHGHGVELQLLRRQSHLHPLRVSTHPRDSAHLTAGHRLQEAREGKHSKHEHICSRDPPIYRFTNIVPDI